MFERFVITKAKPGMSRAEFRDHWINKHAPLVAVIPSYWEFTEKYIQNVTMDVEAFRVPVAEYEGVMETWQRENHGHPERLFSETKEYAEKVAWDAKNFADPSACIVLEAEPNVIIDGPRTGYKMFSFNKRKDGITHQEFRDHWGGPHADIVRGSEEIMSCFHRYVQHYITPGTEKHFDGSPSPYGFDGILELWFETPDDLRRLFESKDYLEKLHVDEKNFMLGSGSLRFLLEEVEIKPDLEAAAG